MTVFKLSRNFYSVSFVFETLPLLNLASIFEALNEFESTNWDRNILVFVKKLIEYAFRTVFCDLKMLRTKRRGNGNVSKMKEILLTA